MNKFRNLLIGLVMIIGGLVIILSCSDIKINWMLGIGKIKVSIFIVFIPLIIGCILKMMKMVKYSSIVYILGIICIIIGLIYMIDIEFILIHWSIIILLYSIIAVGLYMVIKSIL